MEPGVDEDRAGPGMGDQEGRARHPPVARARRADAGDLEGLEPSAGPLEEGPRQLDRTCAERLDDDRGAAGPARKGVGDRLGLCVDLHWRVTLATNKLAPWRSARP